jgi:hypothetical protein
LTVGQIRQLLYPQRAVDISGTGYDTPGTMPRHFRNDMLDTSGTIRRHFKNSDL